MGRSNARREARRIFAVLQNRRLNQHIVYTVLDEVSPQILIITYCIFIYVFSRSLLRFSRKRRTQWQNDLTTIMNLFLSLCIQP